MEQVCSAARLAARLGSPRGAGDAMALTLEERLPV
jgi:hypothetical protein